MLYGMGNLTMSLLVIPLSLAKNIVILGIGKKLRIVLN